jgi:hypothetical protein
LTPTARTLEPTQSPTPERMRAWLPNGSTRRRRRPANVILLRDDDALDDDLDDDALDDDAAGQLTQFLLAC